MGDATETTSLSISQAILDSINIEQQKKENIANLEQLGGIDELLRRIGVNSVTGWKKGEVVSQREKFGDNTFPESPLSSFFELLFDALTDTTLLILIAAAIVSLVIGVITEPANGWIEGSAILIAVALVSVLTASNDYSKQLQFRALEQSSQEDERVSVLRDGIVERVNPRELVIGDILILQAGDMIPADSIIITHATEIRCNESSLTGEPDDLKKQREKDCFLLSSCLITEGEEVKAMVLGIGMHSQWGKIKANLVTESVNTPLQDKLEDMTALIGKIGMVAAFGSFIGAVVQIWTRFGGQNALQGFVQAFILAVTIVVVAIPEGLPLAVTIALAYSTKKMYSDQCFIRILAACETMGNATNICSDKTGTLTENRMTVVEGWFGDVKLSQDQFTPNAITEPLKRVLAEHVSVNRSAYLIFTDSVGNLLDKPTVIGNKTEGALIMMIQSWGFSYDEVKKSVFDPEKDKIFSFNSEKKRSTAILHRRDGSVRVYVKGASEWILKDCTMFLEQNGAVMHMSHSKRTMLQNTIEAMAHLALRTLCLAHKDFSTVADLPADWQTRPPDDKALCLDCIVGIIDPLRSDVVEAVKTAQAAGVTVRMITGDNIATASAIARQCGILTPHGLAIEGPVFRKMSPKEVDAILPKLQVMARSSPDDKYLLVTRLNGHGVPDGREEWEEKFKGRLDEISWDKDRDRVLPGYKEEWNETRPDGGQVVGVTGDGTNDAPALKAADVGLAMGITGTKVAQGAADIVILDDQFSSIVRAIRWGRAVYDNIRKFLQFQLTVNLVALVLVFIGAAAGFDEPLNAVQLLWVNLIMDTMGALALATEPPTPNLLNRKPYKRNAPLISRTMWRNIMFQTTFQLILLFVLLFDGPNLFHVRQGITCGRFDSTSNSNLWNPLTGSKTTNTTTGTINCNSFVQYCGGQGIDCVEATRTVTAYNGQKVDIALGDMVNYETDCLTCSKFEYMQGSIIFNAFIFCQIFNEYTSRKIFDEWNMFEGVQNNMVFICVSIFTMGCQIFLIEVGGDFVKTSPLTLNQWLITIALGAIGLPVGVIMRFIPVPEDPKTFFDNSHAETKHSNAEHVGGFLKV